MNDLLADLRFTIRDNVLVSVRCGGLVTATPTPAIPGTNGAFSFIGADGSSMTGRMVSVDAAVGTISIAPCSKTDWDGVKLLPASKQLPATRGR